MGILGDFELRLPRLRGPGIEFYRLFVKVGKNEPHLCLLVDSRVADSPVVLKNEQQFVMPEDPNFKKTGEDFYIRFRGDLVPLYEAEATTDPSEADLDIPDAVKGATIPRTERSGEEIQAWMDGDGELPDPR